MAVFKLREDSEACAYIQKVAATRSLGGLTQLQLRGSCHRKLNCDNSSVIQGDLENLPVVNEGEDVESEYVSSVSPAHEAGDACEESSDMSVVDVDDSAEYAESLAPSDAWVPSDPPTRKNSLVLNSKLLATPLSSRTTSKASAKLFEAPNLELRDLQQNSIFHLAATAGAAQSLQYLLHNVCFDRSATNMQGFTASECAANEGFMELSMKLRLQ
jgi:hypothetical protein